MSFTPARKPEDYKSFCMLYSPDMPPLRMAVDKAQKLLLLNTGRIAGKEIKKTLFVRQGENIFIGG